MSFIIQKRKEIFLFLIMISYLIFRFNFLTIRYYDHDELEHLNASWSVANGLLPYLDFFEHHFPWLYHSSSFIFSLFSSVETIAKEALDSILFARYYMQLFFILSSVFLFKGSLIIICVNILNILFFKYSNDFKNYRI